MYKKYCLIVSILLIIPIFTTSMEVEEEEEKVEQKEQQKIYIQTNDNRTFIFSSDFPLFSQSTFFRPMMEGGFQEKGTKANPIILPSINGKQLEFIVRFIKIKTDPLKQYLQDFDISKLIETINLLSDIDNLSQLIVASDFLDVKGILEFMVPHLVKHLQNSNVLNAWLKSGGNELLDENEALSDLMKQNLTRKIIKIMLTPQYLQQKKSIPSDILTGHSGWVKSVAFSPDGTILASGSADGTIKLWDTKTGTEIRTFTEHKRPVESVAFSPDGTILASESDYEVPKFWNVKTGKEILMFTENKNLVRSATFSPNGTMLALGLKDGTIKFCKVKTDTEMRTLTCTKMRILTGHTGSVLTLAFNQNGTVLASGSLDMTVKIWNVEMGTEICTLTGHKTHLLSVVFSPDGTILASTEFLALLATVKFWNVKTCTEILTFPEHIFSVAFNPDGTILASGSVDRTIKLWDVKMGTEIRILTGHNEWIFSVAFSPDGTILASGSWDKTIRLWHLIDLQKIEQLSTPELLLIHAWQHAEIINLQTYQELNTIYKQASDSVKKLIKTLTPQPEKSWWQGLLQWKR